MRASPDPTLFPLRHAPAANARRRPSRVRAPRLAARDSHRLLGLCAASPTPGLLRRPALPGPPCPLQSRRRGPHSPGSPARPGAPLETGLLLVSSPRPRTRGSRRPSTRRAPGPASPRPAPPGRTPGARPIRCREPTATAVADPESPSTLPPTLEQHQNHWREQG